MKNDSDAAWYTREMLTIVLGIGLFSAVYWLPALGERLGIEDIDLVRRLFGILLGVYLIVDGNRTPRMALVPPSHFAAVPAQRLLRAMGWISVAIGSVCVLVWFALPIDTAYYISAAVIFASLLLACGHMFIALRRARQLKGEVS